MAAPDTVALLAHVSVFEGLAPDDLERVASVAVPRSFEPGQVVFREGDDSDTCYVVCEGHCRALRTHSDGRTITLATFGAGELFGELAMFDDEKRSATVEAIDAVEAIAILGPDMRRVLREHPDIAAKLVTTIGRRLRAANERLARQSFQTVQSRVAQVISQLVVQDQAEAGGHAERDVLGHRARPRSPSWPAPRASRPRASSPCSSAPGSSRRAGEAHRARRRRAPALRVLMATDRTPRARVLGRRGGRARRRRGGDRAEQVSPEGREALALPKGHPDEGETMKEAAAREVREETGLEAELIEKLGDVKYWYQRKGRRILKKVTFYLFEFRAGSIEDHDDEIEEVRWMPLEQAARVLSFPGEREMVKRPYPGWPRPIGSASRAGPQLLLRDLRRPAEKRAAKRPRFGSATSRTSTARTSSCW